MRIARHQVCQEVDLVCQVLCQVLDRAGWLQVYSGGMAPD